MSEGVSSHGIVLSWQPTPGGAWADIAELADITPPGLKRNDIEITVHDDDIDAFVEGVLRRDPTKLTINYLAGNTQHDEVTGLVAAIVDKRKTGFRMTFPNTDVWIFSGGVSGFMPKTPVDGAHQADVTIRPTGKMKINAVTLG